MATISQTYTFVAGAIPTAAQWNSNWTTVINAVNGNLDADNVDTTAVATLATANTWTADQTFNDSVKVSLGSSGDADLYYDGTDVILNTAVFGSGDFVVTGGSVELDDSEGVTLGTGKDATIQYNGTDLVISPAAVGAGDVVVSGGSVELDDSEGVTLGTGKDATLQYDGTNVVLTTDAVGSGVLVVSNDIRSDTDSTDDLGSTGVRWANLYVDDITVTTSVTSGGVITGATVEATGDTSADDNAAMGYTATEGLILTGQGSTNDVTIKNDADTAVISIPTGTTGVTMAGTLSAGATTVTSLSVTEGNITNVGDIALDSISSDAGTTISVTLGTDAGDDFIVGNNNAFRVEGDTDNSAFGSAAPTQNDAAGTTVQINGPAGAATLHMTNDTTGTTISDGMLVVQSGLDCLFINREAGKIELRTTDTARFTISATGVVNISNLTASSDVQTDGSKNLVSVSDERLKVDLGTISDGALDVVNQLVPKYFKWQSDIDRGIDAKQLGFFAQQINPLIPEAAPVFNVYGKDEDGNDTDEVVDQEWGFNGRAIVAYLVKGFQELTARVETLEAQ